MAYKTSLDISSENFDYYFLNEMADITQSGKESIPKDIFFKIFSYRGDFKPNALGRLSFLTKLFILWKCLGKRWYIVVEDEKNGMGLEDFKAYQKSIKKRDYSLSKAGDMKLEGHFFLGNKELGDTLQYLNTLSASPAYNYLIKGKNKVENKTAAWIEQMEYIVKFLAHYESNRKRLTERSINIPEWYVLISLFHGKEMAGAELYNHTFKKAFQSSPGKIRTAFCSLQTKGMIEKIGVSKGSTLKITALGRSTVISILEKYALNC